MKKLMLLCSVVVLSISCAKENNYNNVTTIEGAVFEKIAMENVQSVISCDGDVKSVLDLVFYAQGVELESIEIELTRQNGDDIEDVITAVELVKAEGENNLLTTFRGYDDEEYQAQFIPYADHHLVSYGERYQLRFRMTGDLSETEDVEMNLWVKMVGLFGEPTVFSGTLINGSIENFTITPA